MGNSETFSVIQLPVNIIFALQKFIILPSAQKCRQEKTKQNKKTTLLENRWHSESSRELTVNTKKDEKEGRCGECVSCSLGSKSVCDGRGLRARRACFRLEVKESL